MKWHFRVKHGFESGIPDINGTVEDDAEIDPQGETDREVYREGWQDTLRCHYGENDIHVWMDDECGYCGSILVGETCERCMKNALFAQKYGNNSPKIPCTNCSNLHSAQYLMAFLAPFGKIIQAAKKGEIGEFKDVNHEFKVKKISAVQDAIDVELVECPKCLKNQGEGQDETSRVSGDDTQDQEDVGA
jgi:hypothetical protein